MTINEANYSNDSKIVLWDYHIQDNTKWWYDTANKTIRNKRSGKAMVIIGRVFNDGQNIVLSDHHVQDNTQWEFERA